jgi:hypothetical protein
MDGLTPPVHILEVDANQPLDTVGFRCARNR